MAAKHGKDDEGDLVDSVDVTDVDLAPTGEELTGAVGAAPKHGFFSPALHRHRRVRRHRQAQDVVHDQRPHRR